MRGLVSRARSAWRMVRGRAAFEAEMAEEFRLHLELRARDLEALGLSPAEAERRARLEFGGVERHKEEARDAVGARWLEDLRMDARLAWRGLRKRPGFALAGAATLALGVGLAAAAFGLFEAAYLRALDYPESDRLVSLWQDRTGQGGPAESRFSPPDFQSVRERSGSLANVAAIGDWSPTLTGTGAPERLRGVSVSHEYFGLFGARPAAGRFFTVDEETPAGERVVVIGQRLWERRFGGAPDVVGVALRLDGEMYTVVGVAPREFRPPGAAVEVWRPIRSDPDGAARMFRVLDVVGRLGPGATLAAARSELEVLAADIAEAEAWTNAGVTFRLARLDERVLGPVRRALLALMGAVGLMLLIACANVAGLLLARGAARGRELAVRAALGARRGRLVRQLLAEASILGLLGGGAAVALAGVGVRLIAPVLPPDALPGVEPMLRPAPAAAAIAISLATALGCALPTALRQSAGDLGSAVRSGADIGRPAGALRARGALVAAELALSLVLLTGAGLFLRSFAVLLERDPGFRAEHALTAEVSLPPDRYADPTSVSRFYEALLEDVRRRPGVVSAGATSFLPLRGGDNDVAFRVEGRAFAGDTDEPVAAYRFVTPGYFRAMGIPVLRGRGFDGRDRADAARVVIVNESLARRYWPESDPIGRRLRPAWTADTPLTVVGVVGDVRHRGPTEDSGPELYLPHAQMAGAARTMALVVRTDDDPTTVVPHLRAAARRLDPELPLDRVAPMDALLAGSIAYPRLHLWTFAVFAALALLLAAVGLYGVVSTLVAQRARDIGVRLAVGASPAGAMRWALRRAAALAAAGIGAGLLGAAGFAWTLRSLLHGLRPIDPATFAIVVLVLGGVALAAALIPARRAARVDPVISLRSE